MSTFRAILVEKAAQGTDARLRHLGPAAMPPLDEPVLVDVAYSSLNYKDALAITGRSPVIRRFPMVPGIDLAGTVVESADTRWQPGDEVLVTGWEIGEVHWGGLSERARVKASWIVRRPESLTLFDTRDLGTAGFTAALAVMALERHGLEPARGEVLVTGAT